MGIDEGLRVISRVPDWINHVRSDSSVGKELVRRAGHLRSVIDYVVRHSYFEGRHPNVIERFLVRYAARRCRRAFVAGK